LPSLARQDTRDFEVVVWDASKDDRSLEVVRRFATEHPKIPVRYFRAPRVGSAAQRNDALRAAEGELVVYIDDDTELSRDGVSAFVEAFGSEPELGAASLPLALLPSDDTPKWRGVPKNWYLTKYYSPLFGLRPWRFKSRMLSSGAWWDTHDRPGEVDHLMGCCMGFRKDLIADVRFNEKMQRLAPYALYEDVECTHRLWRTGHKMRILAEGYAVHHRASGQRAGSNRLYCQLHIYNRYLVWRHAIFPFRRWSAVPFAWSCLGELGFKLIQYGYQPFKRADLLIGTFRGYGAMIKDILRGS
jgi:glycosyltransferase involved in cell wall biosynthesis